MPSTASVRARTSPTAQSAVTWISEKLALVTEAHVRMALRLQAAFGLRREEANKLAPARDDRGDRIRQKGATTKGGRPREVRVLTDGQR